ncbi:MAG: hypothetical protein KC912_20420 [Proteobacteria bacterium]|nr:hypothetical protein [Pseudomonadota bacterium]
MFQLLVVLATGIAYADEPFCSQALIAHEHSKDEEAVRLATRSLEFMVPGTPWADVEACLRVRAHSAHQVWRAAATTLAMRPSTDASQAETRVRMRARDYSASWLETARHHSQPVSRRAWMMCTAAAGQERPCGPEPSATVPSVPDARAAVPSPTEEPGEAQPMAQ